MSARNTGSVQPRHRAGGDCAAFEDVALPVCVADQSALAERAPAGEQCIGAVRCELRERERPCPPGRRVARGIGAVLAQRGFIGGRTRAFVVVHERPRAVVVVLRAVGCEPRIGEHAAQQHVEARRRLRIHAHAERACEHAGRVREREVCIRGGERVARGAFQRLRCAADRKIVREARAAIDRGRGQQHEAVGQLPAEVSGRDAGPDLGDFRRRALRCRRGVGRLGRGRGGAAGRDDRDRIDERVRRQAITRLGGFAASVLVCPTAARSENPATQDE